MKKNIFAVCDLEPGYACSFTEYLSHRKNLPFEIHAFTSAESFLAFEKEHEVELLLISARALNSAVKERPIGKIVVLSEGNDCRQSAYSCVYKYQSSAQVLRETLTAYSDAARAPVIFPVMKKTTKIFGIYSPSGGSGKTSFSPQCMMMNSSIRERTMIRKTHMPMATISLVRLSRFFRLFCFLFINR